MKARTKLELRVAELSNKLNPINKDQKKWAYDQCLDHKAFANKSKAVCLDCGKPFSLELVKRKRATCPNCHTQLKVENTLKRTDTQSVYFGIAQVVEDFQVIRHFELYGHYKFKKPVKYFLTEILQFWILPSGKLTMIGRNHHISGYCDSWGGDWSIRKENGYYYGNKYRIIPYKYHPDSDFKPEYSKYGINHKLQGISFISAIERVPRDPHLETLLKCKRYELFDFAINKSIHRYWPSIKICIRNKYKIKDPILWTDYLDLLIYFGKDLRNPLYVCPKNLKKEHDRLMVKKQLIISRQNEEKRKKNIKKAQEQFSRKIKPFLGLSFQEGDLKIKVLETVQEFVTEGELLNHCLFTNEYHLKKNTLILSARIDDKPIETIEVCLKKFKVLQARGFNNQPTDHHDLIVAIVERNMRRILVRSNHKKRTVNLKTKSNYATAI